MYQEMRAMKEDLEKRGKAKVYQLQWGDKEQTWIKGKIEPCNLEMSIPSRGGNRGPTLKMAECLQTKRGCVWENTVNELNSSGRWRLSRTEDQLTAHVGPYCALGILFRMWVRKWMDFFKLEKCYDLALPEKRTAALLAVNWRRSRTDWSAR